MLSPWNRARALAAAWSLAALTGCADDGGPDCQAVLPDETACATMEPSYQDTVEPLIELRCFECHGPGGKEQDKHDLSTYDDVFRQRSSVLNQIYSCRMPPDDAETAMSDAERDTFMQWLVCGAHDN